MDLEEDVLALQLDDAFDEKRKPPPPPPSTRDQRRGASVDFDISNAFQMNPDLKIEADISPPKHPKGKVDLWMIDDGLDEDLIVNETQQQDMNDQAPVESAFDAEGIPIIPDLDELRVEDLMQQTAAAPTVSTFIDYKQLEEAILKHSAFAVFNGIELSVLIKRLVVTNQLEEEDVPWKWTGLISDVSSNLSSLE